MHHLLAKLFNRFAHSPNGWTDGELALQWLEKDFDAKTKEKANGRTHILLMDGHNSHYTPQLLEYACVNNIVILGYPPHCTHALQGLNIVCFAKFKNEFWREIQIFENLHMGPVKKTNFAGVLDVHISECSLQRLLRQPLLLLVSTRSIPVSLASRR